MFRSAVAEVRTDVTGGNVTLDVSGLSDARFQVVIVDGNLTAVTLTAKQSCDPHGQRFFAPPTGTTLTAEGITDSFSVKAAAKLSIEVTAATGTAGSRAQIFVCGWSDTPNA